MSRISRCSWSVALLVFFFFLPVHHASDRNKTRKLAESSMADGFVWISRPSNVRTATGQSVAVDCQALWKSRIFNGTWTRFITTDSVQGSTTVVGLPVPNAMREHHSTSTDTGKEDISSNMRAMSNGTLFIRSARKDLHQGRYVCTIRNHARGEKLTAAITIIVDGQKSVLPQSPNPPTSIAVAEERSPMSDKLEEDGDAVDDGDDDEDEDDTESISIQTAQAFGDRLRSLFRNASILSAVEEAVQSKRPGSACTHFNREGVTYMQTVSQSTGRFDPTIIQLPAVGSVPDSLHCTNKVVSNSNHRPDDSSYLLAVLEEPIQDLITDLQLTIEDLLDNYADEDCCFGNGPANRRRKAAGSRGGIRKKRNRRRGLRKGQLRSSTPKRARNKLEEHKKHQAANSRGTTKSPATERPKFRIGRLKLKARG